MSLVRNANRIIVLLTVKNEAEDDLFGVVAGSILSVILEKVGGALGVVNSQVLDLFVHANTLLVNKEQASYNLNCLVLVVVGLGLGGRAGNRGVLASLATLSVVLAGHYLGAIRLSELLVVLSDDRLGKLVSAIKRDRNFGRSHSSSRYGEAEGQLHSMRERGGEVGNLDGNMTGGSRIPKHKLF